MTDPSGRRHSFDDSYLGTPPWDIGTPQPAIAELAAEGFFRGRVLDSGCGTGEHALLAARLGHDATGIDSSPRAIALAEKKAAQRALQAHFLVADALELGGLGASFDTVVDSGLFHVFDDDDRRRYVAGLGEVTSTGARLAILCFSDAMPGDWGPRRVSEAELRASFAERWRIDELAPARLRVNHLEEAPEVLPEGIHAWRVVLTRSG